MIIAATGCSIIQTRPLQDKTARPDVVFYHAAKIIEDKYVDALGKPLKLDTSGCPDIKTLLMQLDNQEALLTQAELAVYFNPMKAAIGIELETKDDAYYVRGTTKDLPAYQSGIQRGDRLIEIDGSPVDGVSLNTLYFKLQGSPGSEVELRILDKENKIKLLHIRRQIIDPGPAVTDRLVRDKIGYIGINRFDYGTSAQVKAAVKDMQKMRIQSLVLDLRGNSGGLMDEIVKTAELFLKRNTTLVHLSGINAEFDIKTLKWTQYTDIALAVLVDRGTASGAEIFAAALKDNKRAILVGDKTSGTGSIFSNFRLEDGSLLYLRTHYVSSPAGKAIEGRGVEPDIESIISDADRDSLYGKLRSYDDKSDNAIIVDAQLDKAVNYISEEMKKSKTAAR